MPDEFQNLIRYRHHPSIENGTLVLAFEGWMDGGEVSTGTVSNLIDLLSAKPVAEIDGEPFYIYNFPGSMEVSALFRPHIDIKDGLVTTIDMPSATFYCDEDSNLIFFVGKEPNLRWRTFAECIFELAQQVNIKRIIFVGSFGGSVPHTREPRLFVTCSTEKLRDEMEQYAVGRTAYEGPGSFTGYMMTRVADTDFEMVSLVAEIPGYLQGANPLSIEAVTRRLATILGLPIDLDSLHAASTEWELQVTSAIEENEELAEEVRRLEKEYDRELAGLDD